MDSADLSRAELIAAVRDVEADKEESLARSGRLLAALHATGLSWPAIARETGLSQSTANRRAQPYLPPRDVGAEQ